MAGLAEWERRQIQPSSCCGFSMPVGSNQFKPRDCQISTFPKSESVQVSSPVSELVSKVRTTRRYRPYGRLFRKQLNSYQGLCTCTMGYAAPISMTTGMVGILGTNVALRVFHPPDKDSFSFFGLEQLSMHQSLFSSLFKLLWSQ